MKKLISKICIILVVLALCDRLAGYALDWLRDHSPDGRYYKTSYSLKNCKEELIIIGSSRGEQNYVPKIFEDSLGFTCWNASRGGQGLPYFRAIEEGILNRYTPKVIILNVDENDLISPPDYEIAGVLRPYYHSCPPIRPVLNKASNFEWLLMQSRLYEYNSSFYYLLRPYFIHGLDGNTSDKGWKPNWGEIRSELTKEPEIVREIDKDSLNKESVALFETFVKKIRQRGCQLIFVVSPNYGRSSDFSLTVQYLREKSKKDKIPLFVYSSDTSFITNPDYFADPDHLNVRGAQIFTRDLVHKIKSELIPDDHVTHNGKQISYY
jgi:hypothetical protein